MRIEAKKPYDFDKNENKMRANYKKNSQTPQGKNRENLNHSNTNGFWANNLMLFTEVKIISNKIHGGKNIKKVSKMLQINFK